MGSHFGDPDRVLCSGRRKNGQPCHAPAIAGGTVCRMHGGSTPVVRASFAANVKEHEAARYSTPRRSSPEAALENELARTLGQIDWLEEQIAQRPNDQALHTAQARERQHLTKITSQMMTKNVAARKVVLSEETVEHLDEVLRRVLGELGHDPDSPGVREVIARSIAAVFDKVFSGGQGPPSPHVPGEAEVQPVEF